MSRVSRLRYLCLAYFQKPKAERAVYRKIRRARLARFVEFGVGDGARASRLIQVALRYATGNVQYMGIDLFEADSGNSGASLMDIHRQLAPLGAKIRLVPGEPGAALASVANSHPNTDLIVLSAGISDEALEGAWFYLPRMLHSGSLVLRERLTDDGEPRFDILSPLDVQAEAERRSKRRAA